MLTTTSIDLIFFESLMPPAMMASRNLRILMALAATAKLSRQGGRMRLMGGVGAIKSKTLKPTAVKESLDIALDGFLKALQFQKLAVKPPISFSDPGANTPQQCVKRLQGFLQEQFSRASFFKNYLYKSRRGMCGKICARSFSEASFSIRPSAKFLFLEDLIE